MKTGKFVPRTVWSNYKAQNREIELFPSRECTVEVGSPSLTFEAR